MNEQKVFQLVYVSSAVNQKPLTDIHEILKVAVNTNAQLGITGALLFHAGYFLQLLEGDEIQVRELYEKIKTDKRHNNVITLIETNTNPRIYSKWAMAFKEMSEQDLRMVNNIMSWTKLIIKSPDVDHKLILKIMENFKKELT
jgi:hypothetical protein